MLDSGMLLLVIIFSASGFIALLTAIPNLKRKRLIENTPTSKIRGLAVGFVEIYGKVLPIEKSDNDLEPSTISPLSKKKCVYYRITVEELRTQGKHTTWVLIHSKEYKQKFYVKDESGKVIVNPESASFSLVQSHNEISKFRVDPSKNVQSYLNENNLKFENFLGMNKQMRYCEYTIPLNESLYVMGDAQLLKEKSTQSLNQLNHLTTQSTIGSENLIICKKRNSPFFISDKSEIEVLKKYKLYLAIQVSLGAIFLITGLVIFIVNM